MKTKNHTDEVVSDFEWRFVEQIEDLGDLGTEGFQLRVSDHAKPYLGYDHHHTYHYYDLASLTKILFTTHEVMRLQDEKKLKLSDSVRKHLLWYPHDLSVAQLLNHTSGLLWWKPFYEMINLKLGTVEKRLWLQKEISQIAPELTSKATYSDINFILLGFLIEELRDLPLLQCFQQLKKLGVHGEMHFKVNDSEVTKKAISKNEVSKKGVLKKGASKKDLVSRNVSTDSYAPTEKCAWRKRTLRGEVHDDNTWALGGVSSHAGLFGTVDDVQRWGDELLKALSSRKNNFGVSAETLKKFTDRSLPHSVGDWGYGFMKPTPGGCSGGEFLSDQAFGHTGFTGVSLWIDPKIGRVISLLSNRVYPTRENKLFVSQRPKIHNSIWLAKENS